MVKCSIKGCKREYELMYLGKPLCWKHWASKCDKEMAQEMKNDDV